MSESWSKEKVIEVSGSFLVARILISAAELDLFTKLESRPRTVEELCDAEGWGQRALRILMDALAAQGFLLRTQDGRYSVPASLRGMLTSDGEESVLPMVLHRARMWETWSNLTEIVRTGRNPRPVNMGASPSEDTQSFIGAMHVIGRIMADRIAESLDLKGFKRMLDVGGAAGTYTMAFLNRAPQMTATLFDLPRVVEIARERLTRDGFIDRVELVSGDYTKDELPGGHDLALLSAVIHSNSREGNQSLFARVFRALEPGGTILVRDFVLDETRTSPPDGAVFAVNMLVATEKGNSYTFEEIREDLTQAGFRNVRMIRDGTRMDQVVAAVK